MHTYDDTFYSYIAEGSRRSADCVVPVLNDIFNPSSICDIGGGNGVWARVWEEHGVRATLVDGAYVTHPLVDDFNPADLTHPINLDRQFDIVQCLEVAEHLPASSAETLVKSLVCHSDVVVFSAATPGQGGEHHINEQPLGYWQKIFKKHRYVCCDILRPAISGEASVRPWYRFNTLVYINEISPWLESDRIKATLTDNPKFAGDLPWRARALAVSLLPQPAVNWIAVKLSHVRSGVQR